MPSATSMSKPSEQNYHFRRHTGYSDYMGISTEGIHRIQEYFSDKNVDYISHHVTLRLKGIGANGRDIVVARDKIIDVMNSVYENWTPPTSDVYSRYNINSKDLELSLIAHLTEQAIEVIYDRVSTDLMSEAYNQSLTAWTQVYGDFNKHNLRAHAPIKLKEKRPDPFQFHMRY